MAWIRIIILTSIQFLLTRICVILTLGCEPITVPMCENINWNMTRLPNFQHQSSQENIQLSIEQYQPLVRTECSKDLLFFLCALFVPICTPNLQTEPILPCRDVCLRVKQGCEPTIEYYNHTWPESMSCDKFPVYAEGVCVSPQAFTEQKVIPSVADGPTTSSAIASNRPAPVSRTDCNCRNKAKLRMSRYVKNTYDYMFRARVTRTESISDGLLLILTISRVFRDTSDLDLEKNSTIMMWTYGYPCGNHCNIARKKKEYIFICNKDIRNHRIMFDVNTCMIARWRDRELLRKIRKWDKIAKMPDYVKNMRIQAMKGDRTGRKIRHSAIR